MGRWRSGQSHLTVNQAALCLRRFESCPAHQDENSPGCNRDCFRLADPPRRERCAGTGYSYGVQGGCRYLTYRSLVF